jgi:monoterpene epsilon-lactone hydrolase
MERFAGKTVLITGGAGGIGRALASAFGRQGATVAIADSNVEALDQAADLLRADCPSITPMPLDITDFHGWTTVISALEARFGGVDILCNNAGTNLTARVEAADPAAWSHVLSVNLLGCFYGCRSVLPGMAARGRPAHIVNISSLSGILANGSTSAYAASKSGVIGLTDSLREELRGGPVGVSLVLPGAANTDFLANASRETGREPDPAMVRALAQGMDPALVAARILDAIRVRRYHVFTHGATLRDLVSARFTERLVAMDAQEEAAPPARSQGLTEQGAHKAGLRRPLPALRPGRAADAELIAKRRQVEEHNGLDAPMIRIGGVECVLADAPSPAATILHFHGGGYRLGSASAWSGLAAAITSATGARTILPDYPLAPEHPFPAALHAGHNVIEEARRRWPDSPLILSGDSAGGGLALALAGALASPSPLSALILFSPWLDLTLSAASYDRCAISDRLFSRDIASAAADTYLQGWPAADPLASPLLAPVDTLPPLLLFASASEALVDDSIAFHRRLVQAGRQCSFHIEPDAGHVWPFTMPDSAVTKRTMMQVRNFMDTTLALHIGEEQI